MTDTQIPLVAAMTGLDPAALIPGVQMSFAGVTDVGVRRMHGAGVEMAMAKSLARLQGPNVLLDGRLSLDERGRPGIIFEHATFALESPEDALSFLVETGRPLVAWAQAGQARTFVTLAFMNEELTPA